MGSIVELWSDIPDEKVPSRDVVVQMYGRKDQLKCMDDLNNIKNLFDSSTS